MITINKKRTSNIDANIGSKIETLRKAMHITRKELAGILGITHQQLQKYEKGINRITASRLIEVADALGVSVVHFLEDFMDILTPEQAEKQKIRYEIIFNFSRIEKPDQQEAVRKLIKILAEE